MKVLIVEDNEDSRNLLSKQLRAYGHEVVSANNGGEALKQALEDAPDILVSDIQMPEMDGYQLCREWKQNAKLKDIPVVFYTATYTSAEDEKFALNLGAAAFVRKPTEPDVLIKILSGIIERAASGLLSAPAGKPLEQYEYLEEHNRRLVAKLQKKIEDLNLEVAERKKTEAALRASEERFRGTLDAMLEGYQIIGYDWRYLYINPVAAAQGHYDRNKYYEHTMTELYPGIEKTEMFQAIQKCMREHRPDRIENEFTYPDGAKAWFDLSIEPVPEGILVLSVDISKRKKAESEIKRINRMLRTISECNQLLVRATDEQELLDKICDLVVRSEGFPLAWVGFAEKDEDKTVKPVAFVGSVSEYLNNLKISWDDNEFGRGPVGVAIRTGKTCIARLGTAGSDFPRWHALAEQYGFNSSIALPLISDGNTIGSLNIYAKEEDAFNEGQVRLLTELADDLAYGIAVLRKRQELDIATENLAQSEKKYSTLVEESNDGIIIIQDGEIKFANTEIIEMTGFQLDETIGKTLVDFVSPRYKELVSERYKRRMAGEDVPNRYEIEINRKDGKTVPVEINASIIEHEGRPADMAIIRDITERKEAEEQLAENEARYRSLFENSNDAILLTIPDGHILAANPAACRMFGRSEQEICRIGRNGLMDLTDPRLVEALERRRQTGEFRGELTFVRSDNTRFPAEISSRIFNDSKGNAKSTMIIRDITESKKAEEALKESEERFRQVADSADEWIWEIDAEGVFIYSSPAVERILGYTPEEIIGKKHYYDLYPADVREEFTKTSMAVAEQKQSFRSFANPNVHKNGSIVILDTTATPVLDKEGNLLGYRGVDMDITERIKAEEALKESEERFRNFAQSTHEIIQSIGIDGKIRFVNQAWHDILGYSEEDLSTISLMDIIHPDSIEHCNNMFREVMSGKSFPFVEAKFKKKDGSIVYVEGSAAPRFLGDKVIATQGFYSDVTERKKAEEAVLASETRYRRLFEAAKDGILIVNAETGLIFDVNPFLINLLGLTKEEFIGKELWEIGIFKDIIANKSNFEELRQKGRIRYEDLPLRTHDGRQVDVEFVSNVYEVDHNKVIQCNIRDITERKQAEEMLKDEATRHRILIEQSRDGIVILDQNGGVHEANKRFAEMLGYSTEEVLKLHVWDWEYLASQERLVEMLRNVDEKGDYFETKHRRKDGSIYDVEISTNGAIFAGQKLIFCVCRDITERKKAQDELRESQHLFSTVANTSTALVWMSGTDKLCNWFNEPWLNFTGRTMAQEIGNGWADGVHPDDLDGCFKTYVQAFDSRQQFSMEYRLRRHDGEYRWIIDNGTPRFDAKGNFIGYIGSCIDITERKKAEEDLRKSEESYRFLATNARDLIYRYRLSPNPGFEYVSPSATAITGYTPEEHYADPELGFKMLHPEDRQKLAEMAQSPDKAGGVIVFRWIRKDGSEIWTEQQNTPVFDENGKMVAIEGIARDITQRKKMEEGMIMTERLASIGELSSGIAHELNNPLTSVIGIIQLLMERDDIPDDILKDLQLVNSEGQRAARVVKNLLVFARKHPNKAQLASVNQAVEKILELRAYDQKVNNIQVIRDFAPDLPQILMDYFQIQQVFLNIIINAEFAMIEAHKEGTLIIKTERAGEMVRVSLKDDGPGITKENLKHIFDPFFTTKDVGKGTGLGLSICHGIILQHGGNIYAESEPGNGAKFVVELPINSPEEIEGTDDGEKQ